MLAEAGIKAEAFVTEEAGSATILAREAIRQGCDTILACGGDGTVHEVLQSLVGSDVALGVIPLGTANALAADLGLTASPAKVARTLLDASPVRVSVGRIHYHDSEGNAHARYFTVAAGVERTRSSCHASTRASSAAWATFSISLRPSASGLPTRSRCFRQSFRMNGNAAGRVIEVSQLLVVRVRSFGGVLRHLAPGASLRNGNLSLPAFKTRSRFRYMLFLLAVIAGRHTFLREVELIESPSIECRVSNGSKEKLFVEADGEVLGELPVRIEVVPHSLNLLIPRGARP